MHCQIHDKSKKNHQLRRLDALPLYLTNQQMLKTDIKRLHQFKDKYM